MLRFHAATTTIFAAGFALVLSGCFVGDSSHPGEVDEITAPDYAYQAMHIDGSQTIYAGTVDGEFAEVAATRELGDENMAPLFSPDGQLLAYTHGTGERAEVYLHDFEANARSRLTEFGEEQQCVVSTSDWNPDSDRLVVSCPTGDSTNPYLLAVVDVDGTTEFFEPDQDLLEADHGLLVPVSGEFTTDGDLMAYAWECDGLTEECTDQIRRLDPDDPTNPGEVAAEFDDHDDPRSPVALTVADDGSRAAVAVVEEGEQIDTTHLLVADLQEGTTEELLADEALPKLPLDFHGDDLLVSVGSYTTEIGRIVTLDADDGTETVLADGGDLRHGTLLGDISSDGQRVIFTDAQARLEDRTWQRGSIYLVDRDGQNLQPVDWAHNADRITQPVFNPAAF